MGKIQTRFSWAAWHRCQAARKIVRSCPNVAMLMFGKMYFGARVDPGRVFLRTVEFLETFGHQVVPEVFFGGHSIARRIVTP